MSLNTPLTSPELAAKYRAEGFWRDITLFEQFSAQVRAYPDRTAIVDGPRRISYAELAKIVDNVAGNFLDLGIPPGGIIACQYKNSAELPIVHFAAHRIGCLYLPLHDSWREIEIRHLLKQAECTTLVIPGEYRGFDHRAMIQDIHKDLPALKNVFVVEGDPGPYRKFSDLLAPSRHTPETLAARLPDPDAPATIMLSGGTTSLSKMSRASSNNLINMLDCYLETANYGPGEISAAIAPAGTGATGYLYPILATLLYGSTSIILPRWKDPEEAIDLMVRERCTHATGIPTQLTLMVPFLERRKPEDFAAFKLFTNAGAPLPYDTARKIEALMGCKIQSIYGATDGGTPTMGNVKDSQDKRLGTVGRVVRGCECFLWDPQGKPVPTGERGEVVWRGPDKSWGYLNDEAATKLAFTDDGFYKSGDLGEFDAEGYLRIVGRIKDMILRGGRNISPRTSEEVLIKHPAVLEVAVAAMPDPVLGERACAFVILHDGKSLSFDEMVAFLQDEGKLAIWQLPERLEIVDDMPRSTGAKIAKAKLTAMVTEKLKAEGKLTV